MYNFGTQNIISWVSIKSIMLPSFTFSLLHTFWPNCFMWQIVIDCLLLLHGFPIFFYYLLGKMWQNWLDCLHGLNNFFFFTPYNFLPRLTIFFFTAYNFLIAWLFFYRRILHIKKETIRLSHHSLSHDVLKF